MNNVSRRSFLKTLGLSLSSHFLFLNLIARKGWAQQQEREPMPPEKKEGEGSSEKGDIEHCGLPVEEKDLCWSGESSDTCTDFQTDPDFCGSFNKQGSIVTDFCGTHKAGTDNCGWPNANGTPIMDFCFPDKPGVLDPDACDEYYFPGEPDICEMYPKFEPHVTCAGPWYGYPPPQDAEPPSP